MKPSFWTAVAVAAVAHALFIQLSMALAAAISLGRWVLPVAAWPPGVRAFHFGGEVVICLIIAILYQSSHPVNWGPRTGFQLGAWAGVLSYLQTALSRLEHDVEPGLVLYQWLMYAIAGGLAGALIARFMRPTEVIPAPADEDHANEVAAP